MERLNTEQQKAVEHLNGPCLVIAGAGSGKTKVLTTRIAKMIEDGIPPYQILAITFTNKAAKEMKSRVEKIVDETGFFIGTFHSLGLRLLRENHRLLGFDSNFTIIDSDDVTTIIKRIMKDKGLTPKDIAPNYVRNRISFIKSEMLNDDQIAQFFNTHAEMLAFDIYKEYREILKKNNSVDFDDLLRLPVELFKSHPDVLEKYQERFKYILIDEYQDTNEVQYQMTKMLAKKHQNIFIVVQI